jgi:hypothetical protein
MESASALLARARPLSFRPDRLKSRDLSTCVAGWQSVQTLAAAVRAASRAASCKSQQRKEMGRAPVRGVTAWAALGMRRAVVAAGRAAAVARGETLAPAILAAAGASHTNNQRSFRSAVAVAAARVALATRGGDPGQRGGGGGGAIQIVSQKSVSVSSTSAMPSGIHAGGGAGQGDQGVNFNDGGGGGGSGGAILIEAPSIAVASGAVLAVNGGGGGGGYNGGSRCTSGEAGSLSSTAAAGGTGICTGGAGGAGSMLHGADAAGLVRDGGGGGGGGVGRIRLNSLDGTVALGGELSPAMGECVSTGRLNLR